MIDPEIAGVLSQFKSIKNHAGVVRNSIAQARYPNFLAEVVVLINDFNYATVDFNRIMEEQEINSSIPNIDIDQVKITITPEYQKALLRGLDIGCAKAIAILENLVFTLPKDELDKLTALRTELEKLSEALQDINYERNLKEAIDEYEKRDFLASALISSRVIIYALDQIPRKNVNEKVKFLQDEGIIEKDRKDVREFIIKANKKARNFFSHDIKVFSEASDAISLLGDAIAILRIINKLEEKGDINQ